MKRFASIAVAALPAYSTTAIAKEATDILKLQWDERFWSCRSPDTANAGAECAKRDAIGRQLKARGLCLVGAYSTEALCMFGGPAPQGGNYTRVFVGTLALGLLFGVIEAKAEFPRDLQGSWSTTAPCSNAVMQVKGDQFRLNGRQCTRYRAICTFWKEDIAPGNDCSVIVNCQGEFNHGGFELRFIDRNKVRLNGAFDDMGSEKVEDVKEVVLNRCKR